MMADMYWMHPKQGQSRGGGVSGGAEAMIVITLGVHSRETGIQPCTCAGCH